MRGEGTGPVIRAPWPPSPNPSKGPAERSAPVYQLMGERPVPDLLQDALYISLDAGWGWSEQRFSLLDFWKGSEIQVRPWKLGRAEKRTKVFQTRSASTRNRRLEWAGSFLFGRTVECRMLYLKETEWLPVLTYQKKFLPGPCNTHTIFFILYFLWINSLFLSLAFLALISVKWRIWHVSYMFFLIQIKINTWGTSPAIQWLSLCLPMQRVWVWSLLGS